MDSFEIVSLSAYQAQSSYWVEVRWKVSRDDCEPTWHAHRCYDLELPPHSLSELLGAISELLYDQADDIAEAAAQAGSGSSTSGGLHTIPLLELP